MGNIEVIVSTECSNVSFNTEFREDRKPHPVGTPSREQAIVQTVTQLTGAFDITGALERQAAALLPFWKAVTGAGVASGTPEPGETPTEPQAQAESERILELEELLRKRETELGLVSDRVLQLERDNLRQQKTLRADLEIRRQNVADLNTQLEARSKVVRDLEFQVKELEEKLSKYGALPDERVESARAAVRAVQKELALENKGPLLYRTDAQKLVDHIEQALR